MWKTKGVQTSDEVLSLPPGPDYSKLALLQHGYLFLLRQQSNPLDFACCGVLSKLLKQESALTGHPQIEVVLDRLYDLTGLPFHGVKREVERLTRRETLLAEEPTLKSVWEVRLV